MEKTTITTEVITDRFPEDNQILLDEITCKYVQNPDCTEDRDGDFQELTLSSRDGGGGKFININTNNWSISGEDGFNDFITVLKDFKKRMDETFDNT